MNEQVLQPRGEQTGVDSFGHERLAVWGGVVPPAGLEGHSTLPKRGSERYRVHVAADAATTRSAFNRDMGLKRLERAEAAISLTEVLISELMKRPEPGNSELFRLC